jgi:hypothetical protein
LAARAAHRCVPGMVCNPAGRQQFPAGVEGGRLEGRGRPGSGGPFQPLAINARVIAIRQLAFLFAPNVSDSLVSYRRVDDGVRNRAMAHKGLERSCIDSAGRQGVASSMAQHVGVDPERQSSSLA